MQCQVIGLCNKAPFLTVFYSQTHDFEPVGPRETLNTTHGDGMKVDVNGIQNEVMQSEKK